MAAKGTTEAFGATAITRELQERQLGIVVLRARTTKLEDLLPLVPAILELFSSGKAGQVGLVDPA